MKGVKHYTEDGEYKGETHKMDGKVHTGAKHSKTSKVVSHNPGGPFKMKGSAFYGMSNQSPMYKRGLWANIHAKKERGEAPAKPGDKNYPKTLDIE